MVPQHNPLRKSLASGAAVVTGPNSSSIRRTRQHGRPGKMLHVWCLRGRKCTSAEAALRAGTSSTSAAAFYSILALLVALWLW